MDFVSDIKMNMNLVRSNIRPWTDKEGNERYYVNAVSALISDYRTANDCELRSYYDEVEMRASGGRVRQIIESNNQLLCIDTDCGHGQNEDGKN